MAAAATDLAAAGRSRLGLADQLESVVLAVSEQVAAAATEMGASAGGLAAFANEAVGHAEGACRPSAGSVPPPNRSGRPLNSSPESRPRRGCSRSTPPSRP